MNVALTRLAAGLCALITVGTTSPSYADSIGVDPSVRCVRGAVPTASHVGTYCHTPRECTAMSECAAAYPMDLREEVDGRLRACTPAAFCIHEEEREHFGPYTIEVVVGRCDDGTPCPTGAHCMTRDYCQTDYLRSPAGLAGWGGCGFVTFILFLVGFLSWRGSRPRPG